jgi:hypothetical protein
MADNYFMEDFAVKIECRAQIISPGGLEAEAKAAVEITVTAADEHECTNQVLDLMSPNNTEFRDRLREEAEVYWNYSDDDEEDRPPLSDLISGAAAGQPRLSEVIACGDKWQIGPFDDWTAMLFGGSQGLTVICPS